MDGSDQVLASFGPISTETHESLFFPAPRRYVANRLSEMGETAMSTSTSTDMTDVDMASIAEDELSEKFSVQGVATGKTSGKTKIVSTRRPSAPAHFGHPN